MIYESSIDKILKPVYLRNSIDERKNGQALVCTFETYVLDVLLLMAMQQISLNEYDINLVKLIKSMASLVTSDTGLTTAKISREISASNNGIKSYQKVYRYQANILIALAVKQVMFSCPNKAVREIVINLRCIQQSGYFDGQ